MTEFSTLPDVVDSHWKDGPDRARRDAPPGEHRPMSAGPTPRPAGPNGLWLNGADGTSHSAWKNCLVVEKPHRDRYGHYA